MLRAIAFVTAVCVGAAAITPAGAQIMPGIKAPEKAVDAMSIAQMMGCTFAVLGRPSPFDSSNIEGAVGLTFEQTAPDALLAAAEMRAEDTLAFTVDNPESKVWVLNDTKAKRCAVMALEGDLEAARSRFIGDFDDGVMQFKSKKNRKAKGAFYVSKALGLQATVIPSSGDGAPFAVITERKR